MRRAPRIVRSSRARLRWLVVAFGEVVAQAVEPALPARAPGADPLLHRPQRRRLDPARAHTPDLLRADEPAGLQHLKVLYHRRQRHRQRACEFADRGRSAAQPLDDDPSTGIRQGVEDAIDALVAGTILKHRPNYTSTPRQLLRRH